jgi:hypothetical protein
VRLVVVLFVLALSACAGVIHSDIEATRTPGASVDPGALTVVIFEHVAQDFPFHAGLIIDAPQGRVLYDSAGYWHDDTGGRVRDVTLNFTPAREAAYLRRDYFGDPPGTWRVHLFDLRTTPEIAAQLHDHALSRMPLPFGLCAVGVTRVLRRVPEFAGLQVAILPRVLLSQLQSHPNVQQRSLAAP